MTAAAKAVLVTGAGTGIGRAVAGYLAASGCLVYAGARKDCHLRALSAIENVHPLLLDVTQPQHISAAVDLVRNAGLGLHGLVNNAGVATMGSVVDGNDTEFELLWTVNVLGTYRITKAFAPLLVASGGRIANMGSIAGILAGSNLSAYSMSKHALEAFTDCLAQELAPLGVNVSIVEPGTFDTQLAANAVARLGGDPGLPDLCRCQPPDTVATAVYLALFEPRPKRRYLVVSTEEEARMTIRKQLLQLVELNERHPHTYSRSALISMLDEALAAVSPADAACQSLARRSVSSPAS